MLLPEYVTQETNQLVAAVKEEQKRNASALFLNSTYRHSRFSGTYVFANKVLNSTLYSTVQRLPYYSYLSVFR